MRPGLVADAADRLEGESWSGFELLTTERAAGEAPGLVDAAAKIHHVASGEVPDAAAAIFDDVGSENLVALGGGRVIDVAKGIAAVKGGRVAAIPTTLSGAEMTGIHRMPAGHDGYGGVRPALVLADSDLMTSLPEPGLRATSMNALAHAADCLYTPNATEETRKNSLRGAKLIADSLDADPPERNRSDLALGGLLAGQAIDVAGLAILHVLCQTTVRVCGTPHADTYAAYLPVVMEAMTERATAEMALLAEAIGTPQGDAAVLRERLEALGGGRRGLGDLGAERDCIEPLIDAAMKRSELAGATPGEVTREDLAQLIERAW